MADDVAWAMRASGRIACRYRAGAGPTIVFLPGYGSDMTGTKAVALDGWAARTGRAMLRFDYAGCGESDGRFAEGTLNRWRDDALAAIEQCAGDGPLVLVGSSMGGWIALLVAERLYRRTAALVGIAAAPDFTEWGYDADEKGLIRKAGLLKRPNPYGPEPTITTRAFWESGQSHLMLEREIGVDCPVRLIQGDTDDEVPWRIAPAIAARCRSDDVQTILVKGGDHRLSRPQDIALLERVVEGLVEAR